MNEPMAGRRRVLKGMGAVVALPWLESLSFGAPASAPKRLAFVYVPNGVHMADWRPGTTGALGALPPILQPLEKLRNDLVVLTGLTADKARPHGDGGGDHAQDEREDRHRGEVGERQVGAVGEVHGAAPVGGFGRRSIYAV